MLEFPLSLFPKNLQFSWDTFLPQFLPDSHHQMCSLLSLRTDVWPLSSPPSTPEHLSWILLKPHPLDIQKAYCPFWTLGLWDHSLGTWSCISIPINSLFAFMFDCNLMGLRGFFHGWLLKTKEILPNKWYDKQQVDSVASSQNPISTTIHTSMTLLTKDLCKTPPVQFKMRFKA